MALYLHLVDFNIIHLFTWKNQSNPQQNFHRPQHYTSATQCLTHFVLKRKTSIWAFYFKRALCWHGTHNRKLESIPNSEKCYDYVDGQRYWWKDGESVIFDETFVHEVRNDTEKARLILFCNITRPQKNRLLQSIPEWLSNKIMSAAVSPNASADKTGFINCLSTIYWTYDNNRKKLKTWNKNIYIITKCTLLLAMAFYFIFYLWLITN